mmetsp:Transcript_30535/g.36019  ORF Transcript_30535/g.36019 Transcript_30535/m.36019 type:complete len:385 (+) Transcript_30535:66-1220(+)
MAAIFVGATKQHVGKSSSCLGLVSGFKERLGKCGFIKPVGQRWLPVDGEFGKELKVDKDVKLMREYFDLKDAYCDMSPVVLPTGYTKDFVDGKIDERLQKQSILDSFDRIRSKNPFTVVEGTGHCSVGSIINMNNGQVAALLGLPIIMVVNGGLGSAFDELAQNIDTCNAAGAQVKGVLVNKIQPNKIDMVRDYFGRAVMDRWGIPLVGCVPFGELMDAATFMDFENIFNTKMASGHEHRLRHFAEYELATTDLNLFLEKLHTGKYDSTLFLTHASRSDLVTGYLVYAGFYEKQHGYPMQGGILLTGTAQKHYVWPDQALRECVSSSNLPILFTNISTSESVKKLSSYVAKLNAEDPSRTDAVVDQYSKHIDYDKILQIANQAK